MKKLCLLFLLVILISSVSSISTDLAENYEKGETLIVKISGNILQPIIDEDIQLFRKHIQVPIDYDVKKIGENYYFYGIAPLAENNYTLKINNILTTIGGIEQIIDFEQNFSTTNDLVDYSINPGFAIFEDNFEFIITLNEDLNKNISIDFLEEDELVLMPGENSILFNPSENETGFKTLGIGRYSVPIFVLETPLKPEIVLANLSIFPKSIDSILLYGEKKIYPIKITNNGISEVENLIIGYNDESFNIEPASISLILPNETMELNLTLTRLNETIFEIIDFEFEGFYEVIKINITYTENEEEAITTYLAENYTSSTNGYYCSELGGVACFAEETCSEKTVQTLDVNNCCIGECEVMSSGGVHWIGFIIGLIILVILIIVGIKYKKSNNSKESKNPLKTQIIKAKNSNPIFSSKKLS